jgi:hypothetical protein
MDRSGSPIRSNGRAHDLETDGRIAEFKMIDWRGGPAIGAAFHALNERFVVLARAGAPAKSPRSTAAGALAACQCINPPLNGTTESGARKRRLGVTILGDSHIASRDVIRTRALPHRRGPPS